MYMTVEEIRTLSRRIPAIIDATDEEIIFWSEDAFDTINNYCQQDFVYERQVTKTARATTNTLVYLPKVLSGDVVVYDEFNGQVYSSSDLSVASTPSAFTDSDQSMASTNGKPIELFPGNFVLGYYAQNRKYRTHAARMLTITGDWGFAPTASTLLFNGVNELRDAYEAHRVSTVAHTSPDTLNAILSPVATDLETAAVLLNELKGVINSHFGDFVVHNIADTNIVVSADVTDQASATVLLTELKSRFNAHLQKGGSATAVHSGIDADNTATFSVDFVGGVMPAAIRRVFLRLVQRIALRDDPEDHRQVGSPYLSETLGDGYSYDLSNGTLRNLIRPEEAHMLLPFVNRGRVVI